MSKKNKLISIITFTSIIISETFILIIIAIITVIIFWIILSLSLLLMLLLLSLLLLLQGRRKLFYCKEIWVKLSGTIVERGQNVLKLQWLKCPKTIPTIFGPENKWLNTVLLKKPHFTNLNSLNITKNILPQDSQKHVSGCCQKKNICTALFLDAQELYSRITCIFLQIFVQNLLFQCIGSFYLVGGEIISIRQITVWDFYNVIEYFILIEIFGNSDILGNLDTSINSIKTLTFSKQFGLQ